MSYTGTHWVLTRSDAEDFLRQKGTKVAIQVGHEGPYVFAEKGDFIKEILRGPRSKETELLVDYDGNSKPAFVEYNILHMPIGAS